MPPKTLETVLADLEKKLPQGWMYAGLNLANSEDIYQTLELEALALPDGWEVHVKIPLRFQPFGQFDLYKVTPIPTHFMNSTAALVTVAPTEYFAISGDHRLHIDISAKDIQECLHHRSGIYCKRFTPLVHEKRQGCLYYAFRGNDEQADSSCERRVIKPPPQILTIAKNQWVYILPKLETIALECVGDQTTKIFKLQGTGVFTLPPGCAAIGDRYIIPAHLARSDRTYFNITLDDLKHFEINLDMTSLLTRLPEEARVPQTELLTLIKNLPENHEVDVKLSELKNQVRKWKLNEDDVGNWNSPVEWEAHLSLSSIGIFGVAAIISVLVYNHLKRRHRSGACNSTIGKPVHEEYERMTRKMEQAEEKIQKTETELKEMQQKMESLWKETEQLKQKLNEIAELA